MKLETKRKRIVKRPEDRRQEILGAAVKVFEEKGISDATVSDITEAASVAKGTFYLYFDSKEHLLAALRERFVEEILSYAASCMERVGREDWWALTDATVEGMIDFFLDHRPMVRVFSQEGLTPHTEDIFAECERTLNMMFAAGLQAGVDAGAFRVADPAFTASFLHHAVEGMVIEAILFGQPNRDHLVRSAQEAVRRLLA